MKKIYFAAAIRGGRDDAELYKEVIDFMKKDNVVLTEHIGNTLLTNTGEKLIDVEIYERDIIAFEKYNNLTAKDWTTYDRIKDLIKSYQ